MKIIYSCFLLLLPLISMTQLQIERSVLSSLGMSSQGALSVDATLGETSIGFSENSTLSLSIGFHQSEEMTTSIVQIEDAKIIIAPNPTASHLEIKSDQEIEKLSIRDINGRIVFLKKGLTSNGEHIDVNPLTEGTYILEIQTKDNYIQRNKIIISR